MHKQYLLISFFVTNPDALAKLKAQWLGNEEQKERKFLGRTEEETAEVTNEQLGGKVILVDPENFERGILREVDIPVPMGLVFDERSNSLLVTSDFDVYSLSKGGYKTHITNGLFNNLHSISVNNHGDLLVTSTGLDSILQFDSESNDLKWKWLGTHHGYNKTPEGEEVMPIDETLDYRNRTIATSAQTTHVNSAIFENDYILATFFHQGELVKIDANTGKVSTILGNMKSPHAIRKTGFGYSVVDTRNNKVLLLDYDFKIIKEISNDYDWVQDAIEIDNQFYIADANNGKIDKVDLDGISKAKFVWDPNSWKVGGLATLDANKIDLVF